jgi:hypothetical protein
MARQRSPRPSDPKWKKLLSARILFPGSTLLCQLEAEGHDIGGARLESLALREAASDFSELWRHVLKLEHGTSDVAAKIHWPALNGEPPGAA